MAIDPSKGAWLGLDVGDVRIGVALSRSGMICEPLKTLVRVGRRQTLDALEELINQNGVKVCVIGLPLLEGGSEGEQVEKTRAFARSLQRRVPALQIEFEDERHSSGDARDLIGSRRAQQSGEVDRVAAAIILQQYLDRQSTIATTNRGTTP